MVFSLQKNEQRRAGCALQTDRVQAVFYISFYWVIQEDAWEKAREEGLGLGLALFSPSRDCFIFNENYSMVIT